MIYVNLTSRFSKIQIEYQPSYLTFSEETAAGRRSFKSFNAKVEVLLNSPIWLQLLTWLVNCRLSQKTMKKLNDQHVKKRKKRRIEFQIKSFQSKCKLFDLYQREVRSKTMINQAKKQRPLSSLNRRIVVFK